MMTVYKTGDPAYAASMERKPTALIVDDEEVIRNILTRLLEALGFDTVECESSSDAIDMLHQHQPQLILLDMVIPGSDSIEVIETAREQEQPPQPAILVVSASDDLEQMARFIKAGADDFLLKPFNATLFKARLRSVMKLRNYQLRERELLSRLSEQKLKLDQADHRNEEFCSRLAHDLNNPLTGIIMAADLLLMDEQSAEVTKGLEEIIESAERVSAMIKERRQQMKGS